MMATPPARKIAVPQLAAMKREGAPIAMVTAYDAPSARLAEAADIELILVGDSAATTVLGLESTVAVEVDEMMTFVKAVARGAGRALVVADMPFGSYQDSNEAAVKNAVRLIKAGADAVRVEGGGTTIERAAAVVQAGVAVMGHLGLTLRSATLRGNDVAQEQTAATAHRLHGDAVALQEAGCFAIVLETVPSRVAAIVTATLRIPTIGMGAGSDCDGQVLVWHDLLGLNTGRLPRFVKQYAGIADFILAALCDYVTDVRQRRFPEERHAYGMSVAELEKFELEHAASAACEV